MCCIHYIQIIRVYLVVLLNLLLLLQYLDFFEGNIVLIGPEVHHVLFVLKRLLVELCYIVFDSFGMFT